MFSSAQARKHWGQRLLLLSSPGDFEHAALDLFRHQWTHNPAYRRLAQARGQNPDTVQSWREIPAVPQILFKHFRLSTGPAPARHVFHTSGTTTGQPGRHFLSSLDIYRTVSIQGARQTVLACPPRRFIFLTPSPSAAPHSSLSAMFGFWKAAVAPGSFYGQADRMRPVPTPQQSVALCGTAFHFVHWLDHLQGRRFPLPPGSLILETGGFKTRSREMAKPELYRLLQHTFAVPLKNIWNEYGMTELCSQAYAQGPTGLHQAPPWARVLIINPETEREVPLGQIGLVRWLDLANTDSVLAVQTMDQARREKNGFFLLGRSPQAAPRGCSLTTEDLRS
jgi:phenylacetate-coenzyme A ligase PaaK-like adenylate-forming protein